MLFRSVVPGGGVALLRSQAAVLKVSESLTGDEATGARMVARSLEGPIKQIAENAGLEGGVVVEKVRNLKGAEGLNAATGEYVDLVKLGVIDAAKVTRSALQNAASIAALFLTTEAVVADKPEKDAPAMPGGGMEGGVVVEKVRNLKGTEGLNAATGEYVDMVKLGVIDAAKVTRSALQNAASIAALFLTTEAVVADKPEKAAPAMPGGDEMGGMGF